MFYKLPLQIHTIEGALYIVQNCTSDTSYHVDLNLKPRFLIKSGSYIIPSPYTTLINCTVNNIICVKESIHSEGAPTGLAEGKDQTFGGQYY